MPTCFFAIMRAKYPPSDAVLMLKAGRQLISLSRFIKAVIQIPVIFVVAA